MQLTKAPGTPNLADLLDALPAKAVHLDVHGVIQTCNRGWQNFALNNGLKAGDDFVGQNYLDVCAATQGPERDQALAAAKGIRGVLEGRLSEFFQEYPCHSPSQRCWFQLQAMPLGAGHGCLVMHLNVTAVHLAKLDVHRLNSLYAVAAGINEAIVRIKDERELFEQVCRIAVERDGLLKAWIGVAGPASTQVSQVASWGKSDGHEESVTLPIPSDTKDPVGTSLRTGNFACNNDIARNADFVGSDLALGRGFASCAAFPLKLEDRPVGVLVLYAGEAGFFDTEKLNLLDALAKNLSFAIQSRRLNEQLEARVVERTAALASANSELEAFSYSIAHDLRAPLSAINGFGTLLERDLPDDAAQPSRRYLSRIRASAVRMGEMIDALLALAHLSRASMHRSEVDLSGMAQAVLDSLKEGQPERVVRMEVGQGLSVQADSRLIKMVMENLLGNAWKFTSKRDDAEISFGQEVSHEGEIIYVVTDNGIGFDMNHAGKLFGAFERMHGSADFAGTGIGLANVRRIVGRHGGRVWARSSPEQGASFCFTLGAVQ